MENELDVYRIPAKKRFNVWKGTVAVLCTAVSVLFTQLILCKNDSFVRSEKQWNDRLNDYKERAHIEGERQMQRVDNEYSPKINEAQNRSDSLSHELKVLKN